MLTNRFLLLTLFIFLCASSVLKAQPLTGDWKGLIEKNGKRWAIEGRFVSKGPGYEAYLDFIDAGGYRRQFTVSYSHPSIRL